MLRKSVSIAHALQPLRFYYLRVSAAVALAFCVFLVFSAYRDPEFAGNARRAAMNVATPVIGFFAEPANVVGSWVSELKELAAIREENAYLREQNALLQRWQTVAYQALAENKNLKKLVNYNENSNIFFISSRIVSETGGPYSRAGIIASGSQLGIETGMAVVSEKGLVGRIASTSSGSSRVMMVTDINSRIPVISSQSQEKFIAAGSNSMKLDILYLPEHSQIKPGEVVLTSGDGGLIPPGVIVGSVASDTAGNLFLRPSVEFDKLTHVGVVDFSRESQ